MDKRFSKLKYLKDEKGLVFITVLFTMVILAILSVGLMSVAMSNFKQAGMERDFQGVYYIAEAGINQVIYKIGQNVDKLSKEPLNHDEFFERLDEYIDRELDSIVLENFEENFGEQPSAEITITDRKLLTDEREPAYSRRVIGYAIESKGKIGKSSRVARAAIEIVHELERDEEPGGHPAFDYAIYSGGDGIIEIPSGSKVSGSIHGYDINFSASGTKIDGSVISEKSVELSSSMEVRGNIYAKDGRVKIKSSATKVFGDINATGDVSLESGTTLNGSIYTGGQVELKSGTCKVTGDIHSKGDIELGSGASVQNIYTNGKFTMGPNNSINGEVHAFGHVKFGPAASVNQVYTNGDTVMSSNNTVNGDLHSLGDVQLGSDASMKDIYTGGNVEFSTGNRVHGNINAGGYVGSGEKGGSVELVGDLVSGGDVVTRANQGYVFRGNVDAWGNIDNGKGNIIYGHVVSAQNINNQGIIEGKIIENRDPISPKLPKLPQQPLQPLGPDFNEHQPVEKPELSKELLKYSPSNKEKLISRDVVRLIPGEYGTIRFDTRGGAILILESGGSYFFNSITGREQNKILRLDFSNGGNINIYIKNNLKWNGRIEVSEDGVNWTGLRNLDTEKQKEFAKRVYWETHGDFETHEGGDKEFLGTMLSGRDIKIEGGSYIVGALSSHGRLIKNNNYGIILIYASGNLGSGHENNGELEDPDGDGGGDIISSKARVKIARPTREK